MVGALNKLPIAVSGIVFFGDPATFSNVTAIMIGFIAGIVYSYAKAYPDKAGYIVASSQPKLESPSSSSPSSRIDEKE